MYVEQHACSFGYVFALCCFGRGWAERIFTPSLFLASLFSLSVCFLYFTSQLDLSAFTDVLDPAPTKSDVSECNRILEEYCRDLYKIFAYYCQSGPAGMAASLLHSATQTEPRMGNTEFWRFVRDCKLKLQQTALSQYHTLSASNNSCIGSNRCGKPKWRATIPIFAHSARSCC
jgi:hypothetical protein